MEAEALATPLKGAGFGPLAGGKSGAVLSLKGPPGGKGGRPTPPLLMGFFNLGGRWALGEEQAKKAAGSRPPGFYGKMVKTPESPGAGEARLPLFPTWGRSVPPRSRGPTSPNGPKKGGFF